MLVRPECLETADRLLRTAGYQCQFPGFAPTARQQRILLAVAHHYSYRHPERGTLIEVHWRLHHWTPVQMTQLWLHRQPLLGLIGPPLNSLSKAALLLVLSDHGAKHHWVQLKWLSDVAVLWAQLDAPSEQCLLDLAECFDVRRVLAQTALLVHACYQTPLSESLCGLIDAEHQAPMLAEHAATALLSPLSEFGRPSFLEKWRRQYYSVRLRTRLPWRDYGRNLVLCPADWKTCPLPDRWFWLYYLLRLPLWIRRHYRERFTT